MRLRREPLERRTVRIDNDAQKLRLRARPHRGKCRVTGGDIDRRHFIRAESDRWCRLNVHAQAHFPCDLHDSTVADEFGDFDGRDVERIRQRVAHGHASHEFFSIVIRGVFLAVEFKRRRLVVDRRGRRDDGLHAVDGIVECRGIDERFEHRAGLTMRQRVIELALPVIAPANDRLDLSSPRIQRD